MELWVILILLASATWAAGNYLDAYLIERFKDESNDENDGVGTLILVSTFFQPVIFLTIIALSILLPIMGVTGEIDLFSMSMKNVLLAMSVGILEIVWIFPYLQALEKSDETQSAPLFQAEPVFGLLFGILFFSEVPLVMHIIGGAVVIAGALILNVEEALEEHGKGGWKVNWGVIWRMLAATAIIAFIAFVFKGTALEEQNYWATAFFMSLGMTLGGIVIWIFVPKFRREFNSFIAKRDWVGIGINAVNEIMDNVAILAFYAAVVLGPSTALVQAMKAFQPVFILAFGIVLGWLGSKRHEDKLTRNQVIRRTVGVLVIVGGSLLIF